MDDDLKQKFAEIFAELHALGLIVNEACSLALSHEQDPDNAIVLARKDIDQIIGLTEKTAIAGPNAEFRRWHVEKVRSSVKTQLDAIEKRLSHLKQGRAIH
jgi:hypothetical protein